MISEREKLMEFLLAAEPSYKEEHLRNLERRKRPPTISSDVSDFSHFVGDRLKEGRYENAARVFQAIESLLDDLASADAVKDAVCTSFLENLLNFFTESPEILATFVPMLGPKSRDYCRAWDKFTGVKTPGLWDSDD